MLHKSSPIHTIRIPLFLSADQRCTKWFDCIESFFPCGSSRWKYSVFWPSQVSGFALNTGLLLLLGQWRMDLNDEDFLDKVVNCDDRWFLWYYMTCSYGGQNEASMLLLLQKSFYIRSFTWFGSKARTSYCFMTMPIHMLHWVLRKSHSEAGKFCGVHHTAQP